MRTIWSKQKLRYYRMTNDHYREHMQPNRAQTEGCCSWSSSTCCVVSSVDLLIMLVGTGPYVIQLSWPYRFNGTIQLAPGLNLTPDTCVLSYMLLPIQSVLSASGVEVGIEAGSRTLHPSHSSQNVSSAIFLLFAS